MWPNLKPSQRVAVVGSIPPQSTTTTLTSAWVSAAVFLNYMAIIEAGTLGASATLDAKFQQATDSSGTGAKDVTGKSLTQVTKAAANDNTQSLINLKQEDLDTANGFAFIRVSITVATAASLVSALLLGFDPSNGRAHLSAAASQLQAVG